MSETNNNYKDFAVHYLWFYNELEMWICQEKEFGTLTGSNLFEGVWIHDHLTDKNRVKICHSKKI